MFISSSSKEHIIIILKGLKALGINLKVISIKNSIKCQFLINFNLSYLPIIIIRSSFSIILLIHNLISYFISLFLFLF